MPSASAAPASTPSSACAAAAARSLDRRLVEPLDVVHDDAQRALLARRGQHAERGRTDDQPLAADARPERERRAQSCGLGRGQVLEMREYRAQQLQETSERDRGLVLDAPSREHVHPCRFGSGVGLSEQRALADARLSADDEHAARADACVGEEALDRCALRLATEQHAPSMPQAQGTACEARSAARRRDQGSGPDRTARRCLGAPHSGDM